ncbi:MAG: DUF2189 domain-containing protein [Hyphomicrobiaceae bacterium]
MTETADTSVGTPLVRGVTIRKVSVEAPWDWIGAGWQDLWVHPQYSLAYGAVFAAIALLMFLGFTVAGLQSLIVALAGGFMLLAPAIAVGLYELSRRISVGEPVSIAGLLAAGAKAPGQLSFLGAMLAFFYFVWLETALLLFMLFFGGNAGFPPASQFVGTLLFEPHGLGLLIVGTIVGAILAAAVFAISVVSVPLLLTRRIDAISATYISIEAVTSNLRPMALWAALIAAIMIVGLATFFVGVIVTFPLLGHATWHAFRELVAFDDE